MLKITKFLREEIWQTPINKLPKGKAICFRLLRILMLTSQGFTKSQIQQGASSLTYYSLMAVVPVIALLIGIARGFQLEATLQSWLISHFIEQEEIIKQIFNFANSSLQQARGGVIAGVGIAILAWTTIKILSSIEQVMNEVWEVKNNRSMVEQFKDYLALAFIAPLFIFLASGVTGYLSARLGAVSNDHFLSTFEPLFLWLLSAISFLLIVSLFTFLYIFIPNTRVRLMPALIAGIFTGAVYQLLQWLYFYFQIGMASYNAIYGTFAAFPLFLIWLHLSWIVILIGAKLTFAIQNVDAYEYFSEDLQLSHKIRRICSMMIAHLCIKKFTMEESPPTSIEISNELQIPHPLTSHLLYQLCLARILCETKREDQESGYLPSRNVENLTIKRVLDMIDEKGATLPLPPSQELTLILKSLEQFSQLIERSDSNLLLKDF